MHGCIYMNSSDKVPITKLDTRYGHSTFADRANLSRTGEVSSWKMMDTLVIFQRNQVGGRYYLSGIASR